jgi:hypothetical protein
MTSEGVMANLELLHYLTDISKSEAYFELTLAMTQTGHFMRSLSIEDLSVGYDKVGEHHRGCVSSEFGLVEAVTFPS